MCSELDYTSANHLTGWSNLSELQFNRITITGQSGEVDGNFYFDVIHYDGKFVVVYSMAVRFDYYTSSFKRAISYDLCKSWITDSYDFAQLGAVNNEGTFVWTLNDMSGAVDTHFGLAIDYTSRKAMVAFRGAWD